jgi:hypothetical protein
MMEGRIRGVKIKKEGSNIKKYDRQNYNKKTVVNKPTIIAPIVHARKKFFLYVHYRQKMFFK